VYPANLFRQTLGFGLLADDVVPHDLPLAHGAALRDRMASRAGIDPRKSRSRQPRRA